jgi:2-polyprenyl-3-methyl-5-hydroxy-6-metoxy-1,4-benzoquinol methylase
LPDPSNGYDAHAAAYLARRKGARVGAEVVRRWARNLRPGADVLDLGCGDGEPVARVLIEEGLTVWGVDASPAMARAFAANFPGATVACEAAEDSTFFGRRFAGIIAWGLVFLLDEPAQRRLLRRAAAALQPGGHFCFTAPSVACTWDDLLTGRRSLSLGGRAYREALEGEGLRVAASCRDEGDNDYVDAVRQVIS